MPSHISPANTICQCVRALRWSFLILVVSSVSTSATAAEEAIDQIVSLNNKARAHESQGQYAEAIATYAQAVTTSERAFGLEHFQTAGR